MPFQITTFVLLNAVAGLTSLLLTGLAWQRRNVNGARSLAALSLAVTIWCLSAAVEMAVVSIPAKIFWSKVQYIGVTAAPVLFVLFALEYNRLTRWLSRPRIALYFILPILTFTLAATNEWHHLIWANVRPSPDGFNLAVYDHGPAFWALVVGYAYLCNLTASILLIRAVQRFPKVYRLQFFAFIVAVICPWANSIIYILRLNPLQGMDLTPASFSVFALSMSIAIFRFQFLDLAPFAFETIVETMQDGIVVVDGRGRILDINPSAVQWISPENTDKNELKGKSLAQINPDLAPLTQSPARAQWEFTLYQPEPLTLEVRVSPIQNHRKDPLGRIITFHDITLRRQFEEELRAANARLQAQIQENELLQIHLREQAVRDSLTGLHNRRYMEEVLQQNLARAERQQAPLSLVMIDIDQFKSFNDNYGHKAGDAMLVLLSELLIRYVRREDTACRFGGEEFIVILPGAPIEVSERRAEEWRSAFEHSSLLYNNQSLSTTFSCGVASFPQHGLTVDELIQAADKALYAAKKRGRNCVTRA